MLFAVVRSSRHPYSKAITALLGQRAPMVPAEWRETPGRGIKAIIHGNVILVGSADFTGVSLGSGATGKATVYVRINDQVTAFHVLPVFRDSIPGIIPALGKQYKLSLLSGDNDKQKAVLTDLFGASELRFEQQPIDKLNYIESLQQQHRERVMMIGDGLNDAGALQQSNVGITLADDINNFTPSCDAILDAKKFALLPSVLRLAKA